MKKIVASVGLVALGASALQSASAQGVTGPESTKPWSVAATLRGFYDSNINSLPDSANLGGASRDSFGMEISPSASFGLTAGPTTATLSYTYSMKWYENKPVYNTDNIDQTHLFDAAITHAFGERYNLSVADSFALGQEPDVLRAGNTFDTFQRISGDNIRNYGTVLFDAELTRQLGLQLGYNNAYYNYSDNQSVFAGPVLVTPSYSAVLDRIEQSFHIDGRWHIQPQTTGVLGYQYSYFNYTADEVVGTDFTNSGVVQYFSDVRNSRSHYGYVGADHNFSPDLSGSARVGVRYSDFYNDPSGNTELAPYVRLSARYNYLPDSYVEAGFSYDLSSTDLLGFTGTSFTTSANAANLFASVNHRLTPKLMGSLTGQFQNSAYNGGLYDGESEQFLLAGLNFTYQFNRFLAANAGYSYDQLFSNLGREFNRNRVYIGLTASY